MMNRTQSAPALSVFGLVMLTVVSVDSVRNLPATALFGLSLVPFFFLGALFFLLPGALVSAELASNWPQKGGVYVWVSMAWGRRIGLLAIWLQWIENVIWYPTLLSFLAGTMGYLLYPGGTPSPYFLIVVILLTFWGVTWVNLRGMQLSAFLSNVCSVFGLLLPMGIIIALGGIWLLTGHLTYIHFRLQDADVFRLLHTHNWTALTGVMLSFCGIEIATVHANEVARPQTAFPLALGYATLLILSTLILGALSIAVVLPPEKISLVSGIMQAFDAFFSAYHLHWVLPIIAVMLVVGGIGSVSNWVIAPTKGLQVALQSLQVPHWMQYENQQGAPQGLLIFQAVFVSLLACIFLFFPTINASYWFLTALAAQLYMLMYLLLFATCLRLRYLYPLTSSSTFRIPGGRYWGCALWVLLGGMGATLTFFVSFIPPVQIHITHVTGYYLALLGSLALLLSPPFLIAACCKKQVTV